MRYAVYNEEVQKIIKFYKFEGRVIGQSYFFQDGDPWADLVKEKIDGDEKYFIRVSDKALKFPRKAKEWIVLHECGHIYHNHPLHSYWANPEIELQADLWACCKQKKIKYGVDALRLMSGGNLHAIRIWDLIVGVHFSGHYTYKYFIDEINKRWKLYKSLLLIHEN